MFRKSYVIWFILVPDIVLMYIGLFLAVYIRYGHGLPGAAISAHVRAFSVIYGAWLVVFFIHNLFDVATFRRYSVLFFNLTAAMAVNVFVAIAYFYFQPGLILTPRRFLLVDVLVVFVLVLGWHVMVKYLLRNRFTEGLYLLSFNRELADLEREIKQRDYLGYKILGHLSEQTLLERTFDKNFSIILPDNIEASQAVVRRLYALRKRGVVFYNHKLFYENLLRRIYISQVDEVWFLENINYSEKKFYTLVKRGMDVLAGLFGLVLCVVTFPVLALLVRLSSPGPILFIQERVGLRGQLFKVYKYRTMTGPVTNTWTAVSDPRITRVGRFLRVSRLDELPQCVNVLLGNMSLVGPRPEQPHIVDTLSKDIPFYTERHMVKPGLTGWAQINNVYAASVQETRQKLQYDLYYIKHRSFLFDLEIILKTVYYVLSWKGR